MAYTRDYSQLNLIAQDYKPQRTYLWETLLPKVRTNAAFTYGVFKDHTRDLPDYKTSGFGEVAQRTGHNILTKSDSTFETSLGDTMSLQVRSTLNPEFIGQEEDRIVANLKEELIRDREKEVYTAYSSATGVTGAGNWNVATPGTGAGITCITADIMEAKTVIRNACGFEPNYMWMPTAVYDCVVGNILESGNLTNDMWQTYWADGKLNVANILGVKPIVCDSTYYTGSAHTAIWTNYVWFAYIDPSTTVSGTSPSASFVAESNIEASGNPWYVKVVPETEKGSNWYCEVHYRAKFIELNTANAVRKLTATGGGTIIT